MRVQFDVFNRDCVIQRPHMVYAGERSKAGNTLKPATLLSVIVLEADGVIVPLAHGFSREYQIANVRKQRLTQAFAEFSGTGYHRFRELCEKVFTERIAVTDFPL